jgi:ubiquinone/menaquinone biosynthesis C-methylase UbiE
VNCDPIARWYRWLEYAGFGRALERRREAFIDEVADARRVLVLGEGDGRFLKKLVESCGKMTENCGKMRENCGVLSSRRFSIDYVDLSHRMLDLARIRAGAHRVTYRHGDALTIPLPRAEYDLVVTHFFLDCLTENDAANLIARVAASLQPGARWLISEFREPGPWARAMVAMLYFFFRITTGLRARRLIDHRRVLAARGFVMLREETARFGLLASELWLYSVPFRDNDSIGENGS